MSIVGTDSEFISSEGQFEPHEWSVRDKGISKGGRGEEGAVDMQDGITFVDQNQNMPNTEHATCDGQTSLSLIRRKMPSPNQRPEMAPPCYRSVSRV